jgi:hypothetical protein
LKTTHRTKKHSAGVVPVIPALRRQRQENHEFQASLSSITRPNLKKGKGKGKKKNPTKSI